MFGLRFAVKYRVCGNQNAPALANGSIKQCIYFAPVPSKVETEVPESQHPVQAGRGDAGAPAIQVLMSVAMRVPGAAHQCGSCISNPIGLMRFNRYLQQELRRHSWVAAIGHVRNFRQECGELIQNGFISIGLAGACSMQ